MVLLEEFKDHKMFLIYDFLKHDVCSKFQHKYTLYTDFVSLQYWIIIK